MCTSPNTYYMGHMTFDVTADMARDIQNMTLYEFETYLHNLLCLYNASPEHLLAAGKDGITVWINVGLYEPIRKHKKRRIQKKWARKYGLRWTRRPFIKCAMEIHILESEHTWRFKKKTTGGTK